MSTSKCSRTPMGMEGSSMMLVPKTLSDVENILRNIPGDIQSNGYEYESDSHEKSIPIDAKLYKLLVNGSIEVASDYNNLSKYKCEKQNNSVLHIAASAGQAALITDILPNCEEAIRWMNNKGDLALHSAARAGHFNVLKAFIDYNGFSKEVLGTRNLEGNTVLHIALQKNREKMAEFLFQEYPKACYMLNYDNVSPLYLGIKLGYETLVKKMIQHKDDVEGALLQGKSVVHAAIQTNNINILEELLGKNKDLITLFDDEGQTPLSYAALKGYFEVVQYLHKKFPDSAYEHDKDEESSLPIHKAASGGNIKVINELYQTKQLLNNKDQNILHVAAARGRSQLVSHLLKAEEMDLDELINLQDEDGNTPLHLGSKGFHPRVVYILTRDKRCKCELQNKHGLTALDLAEIHCDSLPTFEARLTWMALRYVNAPRSSQYTRIKYVKNERMGLMHTNKENDKYELENYKGRVDTLLLVATLVATVTFAAGFTLPGGYEQSDPNKGMVVLSQNWAFNVFVFTNTFAMYSSILVVVSLIWAQLGDLKLVLISLRFAIPLLIISLAMMSLAFMMGLFAVLKTITWLSYVVLGMGSLFVLIVLGLSIPLYNPSYIKNPVKRFFFSKILLLLLLVCEKKIVEHT